MAPAHQLPAPIKKDKKTRFLETVAMCSFYTPGILAAAAWTMPGIAKTTNHDTRTNVAAAHPRPPK